MTKRIVEDILLLNRVCLTIRNIFIRSLKENYLSQRSYSSLSNNRDYLKSYRCPKFDGDAKQTLEIRVERKMNLKLVELGKLSFGRLRLVG